MDTPTEKLLRDLGIEVDCCPTCEMCNWEFHGAVDVGIYTVTCRTCGRRYERMTRREEMLFLARNLRLALEVDSKQEASRWYQLLARRWTSHYVFAEDNPHMVCTSDGCHPEVPDDIDF